MEPLKSNVQEIVRAFLNDAGIYHTQGTILQFQQEVTKIANMIESNSMQAMVYIQYISRITLQRGITEDIFEKSQKEIEKFLEIFNKKKKR